MDSDFQYIPLLEQRLSQYRFVHSLNVAESAKALAKKYGGDEEKAHTAGLLHDIMKDTDAAEQLKVIESAGIEMLGCERLSKKLWHAMSGAVYVRDVIGIVDEDIFNAIRYHTTGRENMSKKLFLLQTIFRQTGPMTASARCARLQPIRSKGQWNSDLNSRLSTLPGEAG